MHSSANIDNKKKDKLVLGIGPYTNCRKKCTQLILLWQKYVKENVYRIHFWYMSKDDANNIMNGSNLVDKRGVL